MFQILSARSVLQAHQRELDFFRKTITTSMIGGCLCAWPYSRFLVIYGGIREAPPKTKPISFDPQCTLPLGH